MLDEFLEDYLNKDNYKSFTDSSKYFRINTLSKPIISFKARGEIFLSLRKTLSLN